MPSVLVPYNAELGPYTVMAELSQAKEGLAAVQHEVEAWLPLMPDDQGRLASHLRDNLSALLRPSLRDSLKRYLMVPHDLIVLEVLQALGYQAEVISLLASHLTADIVQRVRANVPLGLDVSVYQVPAIHFGITPSDSLLLTLGCNGGSEDLVLIPETTRDILAFYKGFYFGEVVVVEPFDFPCHSRPASWVTVNRSRFFTQSLRFTAGRFPS